MFNQISTSVGVNLALILNDRKLDLTPVAGSLMDALCQSTKNCVSVYPMPVQTQFLPEAIRSAVSGAVSDTASKGQNAYCPSSHDTVMDNYIVELAQTVGNHVNFARQVVHTKIKALEDNVQAAFSKFPIKEAEDFFVVNFYKLHDLFKSDLIEDEVMKGGNFPRTNEVMNFGDIFGQDFDPVAYFATGDNLIDQLIANWVASVGRDTVISYLSPKSADYELSLFGTSALDFYMANFLFYRQLTIKQNFTAGMGLSQLLTASSTNRDYHAGQLSLQITTYNQMVKQGRLLSSDSQVNFSYLTGSQCHITILEESYEKLKDVHSPLELIFGAIAKNRRVDPTVDSVIADSEMLLNQWKTVRALYTAHLVNSRTQLLKSSLRLTLEATARMDCGEEKDSPIFNDEYFHEVIKLAFERIDQLQASDAQDLYKLCIELMAGIIYRFSNAYFFIREMYEIMTQDDDISAQDASHAAVVRYVTDFLMEQVNVTCNKIA